jgi:hypothetical protein
MLAVFYKYGNGMVASQKGFVHATTRKVFRRLPGSYVRDKSRKDHVRVSSRRYTMFENILKGRYSLPLYPTLHTVILLQLLYSTCIYESVSSLSCPVPRPWPGMECTIESTGPSKHPTGHPQHRQLESHTGLPIPCPIPWRVSSPHIRW